MSTSMVSVKVNGHVLIKDGRTGEVLLDKKNAVHAKNLTAAIAKGLSNAVAVPSTINGISYGNQRQGVVFMIKLGNGGTTIGSLGEITYQSPNVIGTQADLYNTTYSEVIDDSYSGTPAGNSVSYLLGEGDDTSSIVISTVTIGADEPSAQNETLTSTTTETNYSFDELGLFTSDNKLLTHIIFSPIPKTSQRELVITYTLTISMG